MFTKEPAYPKCRRAFSYSPFVSCDCDYLHRDPIFWFFGLLVSWLSGLPFFASFMENRARGKHKQAKSYTCEGCQALS